MKRRRGGAAAAAGGDGTGTSTAAKASIPSAAEIGEDENCDINEHFTSAFEDDIEEYLKEDEEDDEEGDDDAASATTAVGAFDEDAALKHERETTHEQKKPRNIAGLVTILNNVVTATLTTDEDVPVYINLIRVVEKAARLGFQMNTRRFSAAFLSCLKPNCCVLIFAKGKIVCAGCANIDDARYAINKVVGYLRDVFTDTFKTLRAIDIRVRNMVGTMCVPYNIDVVRMQAENMHVVANPISKTNGSKKKIIGVKISPPCEEDVGKNRKKKQRKTGTALVYWSGYLLIIGARSSAEVARSFHYVFPIMQRYFIGSAETSFSAEKIRRYYTGLRTAFERSEVSPKSFIAIRDDGTEGTIDEWRLSNQVEQNIKHFKALSDNPDHVMRNRLTIDTTMDTMAIVDADRRSALSLVATGNGSGGALIAVGDAGSTAGALINATNGNALSIVKASNASKKQSLLNADVERRVQIHEERTIKNALVDSVGAAEAVRIMKPTQTNVLSFDHASGLYQGQ